MDKCLINYNNFNEKFSKILKRKTGKNIIKTRFYLENCTLKFKIDFLINYLKNIQKLISITYKILFWENDIDIVKFLNGEVNDYNIIIGYKNSKKAGEVFFHSDKVDEKLIKNILIHHFNYELAKEPSLNIRLQFALETDTQIILFDIYDDRGLDVYFIKKK